MVADVDEIRGLLVRITNLIKEADPNFGYAVVLVDADERNFYSPLNYATNLVPDGLREVGEFLIKVSENPSDQTAGDGEEPQGP